jgi:hypothetical protein
LQAESRQEAAKAGIEVPCPQVNEAGGQIGQFAGEAERQPRVMNFVRESASEA